MPLSRPGLSAIAIFTLLVLLGWHVHAQTKSDHQVNFADRALLSVTGPMQGALAQATRATVAAFGRYFDLVEVARENEHLREQLAIAESQSAELDELRGENVLLRQLSALREHAPGRTVGANVIGYGTSSRFRTIRIDRGSGDAVVAGLPVVSVEGAVGRVLGVSESYADVLLLTDGLSAAGARLQESRLRGVVVGQGGERLELGYVRRRELGAIRPGELVVTSGEDQIFPEGVPLGRVLRAGVPQTGLFLEVLVESAVDFSRLEHVAVVLDRGQGPFGLDPEAWQPRPDAPRLERSPDIDDEGSVARSDTTTTPAEDRL